MAMAAAKTIDAKTYLSLSLLLLTFNSGSTVLNQATLQSDNSMAYSPFVVAATTEFVKLIIAGCLLFRDIRSVKKIDTDIDIDISIDIDATRVHTAVIMPTEPMFIIKYAVPGLLYAVCNVLNYVVVSMVGSTNYQLLNNMKIITTAIIYRLSLGREIKMIQWTAIMVLTLAMCVAALQNCPKLRADGSKDPPETKIIAGVGSMIFVSCLSSVAGVYNEKLIKHSKANMWYQNVLLYIWTFSFCIGKKIIFPSEALIIVNNSSSSSSSSGGGESDDGSGGLFQGFTVGLWLLILMKAFYGQVVGLVFKYGDNILKVYASSMSVIVSAVLCYVFLGTPLTGASIVAGMLVIVATLLYYNYNALLCSDTEVFTSSKICVLLPARDMRTTRIQGGCKL